MFNSSMELYQHETELRYNLLRYLVWLIPTLGFIGTVAGRDSHPLRDGAFVTAHFKT